MRFNLLSSFAAGIFITTSICSAIYFSDRSEISNATIKTTNNKKELKVQLSEKEMKSRLASAGYIVQTKAEYDNNIKDAKAATQKEARPEDNESKNTVNRVVVNVSEGMTSIDVGHMLEQAKLIQNALNFTKDIESKGLENSLHPGTYVVDSKMSYDQIISTIFK